MRATEMVPTQYQAYAVYAPVCGANANCRQTIGIFNYNYLQSLKTEDKKRNETRRDEASFNLVEYFTHPKLELNSDSHPWITSVSSSVCLHIQRICNKLLRLGLEACGLMQQQKKLSYLLPLQCSDTSDTSLKESAICRCWRSLAHFNLNFSCFFSAFYCSFVRFAFNYRVVKLIITVQCGLVPFSVSFSASSSTLSSFYEEYANSCSDFPHLFRMRHCSNDNKKLQRQWKKKWTEIFYYLSIGLKAAELFISCN